MGQEGGLRTKIMCRSSVLETHWLSQRERLFLSVLELGPASPHFGDFVLNGTTSEVLSLPKVPLVRKDYEQSASEAGIIECNGMRT